MSEEIDINDINRRCAATEYAKAQGAWTLEKEEKKKLQSGIWKAAATKDGEPTCWWWLRSKGSDAAHASSVNCVGKGNAVGDVVNDTYLGVRPVICIKK